jgi:hypothetical protein
MCKSPQNSPSGAERAEIFSLGRGSPAEQERPVRRAAPGLWYVPPELQSLSRLKGTKTSMETFMGLAQYQIVSQGDEWGVLHDGNVKNRYATKEAAFEAAVAAASLAIREGHEVQIGVPDRSSGNQTALGAKDTSQ